MVNFRSNLVSLHYFPKEPRLATKWQVILNIGSKITKHTCVCSAHFTPNDFISEFQYRQQNEDIVK